MDIFIDELFFLAIFLDIHTSIIIFLIFYFSSIQLAKITYFVEFLKLHPSLPIGNLHRIDSTANRQVIYIPAYDLSVIKIPCILQLSNKKKKKFLDSEKIYFASNFTMVWTTLSLTYKLGILLLLNLNNKKAFAKK